MYVKERSLPMSDNVKTYLQNEYQTIIEQRTIQLKHLIELVGAYSETASKSFMAQQNRKLIEIQYQLVIDAQTILEWLDKQGV